MSVISLPRYESPARRQLRIMFLATVLAIAFVAAVTALMTIDNNRIDCRPFTIGRSAIGSCDWIASEAIEGGLKGWNTFSGD